MAAKYEPVNVNVKEDKSKDGDYCRLVYRVKDIRQDCPVDWRLEQRDDGYYAVFKATVNDKTYYHESKPMPQDVYDNIKKDPVKKFRSDKYKVKLMKKKEMGLTSYFF